MSIMASVEAGQLEVVGRGARFETHGRPLFPTTRITIQGIESSNTRVVITGLNSSSGSQPGSTRSAATDPSRGPKIPGSTSITSEKLAGLQIAPIVFGPWPPNIPMCSHPLNAPVRGCRFCNIIRGGSSDNSEPAGSGPHSRACRFTLAGFSLCDPAHGVFQCAG
jgi:hypothetical protein